MNRNQQKAMFAKKNNPNPRGIIPLIITLAVFRETVKVVRVKPRVMKKKKEKEEKVFEAF